MAKKDLVVNIDSKTKGLEQGVSKSVNEVRKLEKQTQKSKNEFKQFDDRVGKLTSGNLSGLLGTMGSVAGILGVAKLAQEGFNKTMRSSQTTSDAFDLAIEQAKGGVDYFFQSLATGSFKDFVNGLDGAIRRAGDLVQVLDELGDKLAGWDDISSELNMKISMNRAEMQDETITPDKREELLRNQENLIKDLRANVEIINDIQEKTIRKTIASIANIDNVTNSEITEYLQKTSMGQNIEFNEYIKKLNKEIETSKQTKTTQTISNDAIIETTSRTTEAKLADGKIEKLKEENVLMERQRVINELVLDLQRKGIVTSRDQVRQRFVLISNMERQLSRDKRRDFSGGKNIPKTPKKSEKTELELNAEIVLPEGSLSAINEKISKLNVELSLEIDEDSRIDIWKQIKELEDKKLEIEVGYKQEETPVIPTPIEGVRDTMFDYNKTTADKLNESLQLKNSHIYELRKETELFAKELAKAEKEASSLQDQLNFQNVKDDLKSFNNALTDSYMDVYNQTMNIASAFTNLANSVQSLNEDDTASKWEKLLNVFSAVGGAIQSLVSTFELYNKVEGIIASITAAKQVEMGLDGTKVATEIAGVTALTTAKVTAAGVETAAVVASNVAITASLIPLIAAATTLMAAESTAAYAMIPFVGVGLAASQIASMQGLIAMASIPKFADGGLVYGNTIAQVGEYAGASSNPEVIAPLSKLRDILSDTQQGGAGGSVDFRIAGKDLVGTLNNYSSKQSKK